MNSLISTKEAAKRLNISVRRVQALISAGRLPAEKIGNSFVIKELDLRLTNGRKNGRPANNEVRSQEFYNKILLKYAGCLKGLPSDLSTNKKYLEGLGSE
jgi:excisionase family DNA binding protein